MSTDITERKRLAVIRIRGSVNRSQSIRKTMELLRLNRANHCVLIDNRSTYRGMLQKAKDFITWGEIDFDTMKELLLRRGKLPGNVFISEEYIKNNSNFSGIDDFVEKFLKFEAELKDINLKPVFRLHPPRKGFESKGVKRSFNEGGSAGYRGTYINDLIKKMS